MEQQKPKNKWDLLPQEEKDRITKDAPKWWDGMTSDMKIYFANLYFKKNPLDLTESQIRGMFHHIQDKDTPFQVDIKFFEEYAEYMMKNGWWENEGPFHKRSAQGIAKLLKDPNSPEVDRN